MFAAEKVGIWKDTSTVPFFNTIAHEKNFHPLKDHDKWYEVKLTDIVDYKVV